MALKSKVGVFGTGTGAVGTTVPVTGVGFQPQVILFWWSGRSDTSDAAGPDRFQSGFGFAASPTDRRCVTAASDDGAASSNSARMARDDVCVLTVIPANTIDGMMDIQSIIPDGFTLVVTNQFSENFQVHYLALGGDITNAVTGQFTDRTSAGNQDITGVGFQPDLVLFISSGTEAHTLVNGQVGPFSIGAAISSSEQATLGGRSLDNQATMNTRHYASDGDCMAQFYMQSMYRAQFVEMLPDGFRIYWPSQTTAATYTHYLAIKGGNYKIGSFKTRTDGNDIPVSGLGFQPSGIFFASSGFAEDAPGSLGNTHQASLGACSSPSERGAQGWRDENGAADSNVANAIEHDAVYVRLNTSTDDVAGVMDVKSIDADGFTCVMDDPDPDPAFVWYVAFGPAAATAVDLAVQDAGHSQSANTISLVQAHHLLTEESQQAQNAESPTLAQLHILAGEDSLHSHSAEDLSLIQAHALAVQDAEHEHLAGEAKLTQLHQLTVQDASHSQSADPTDLNVAATLDVSDSLHSHTAENTGITASHFLSVEEAHHAATSDAPELSQLSILAAQDTRHTQTSESPSLHQAHNLSPQYTRHAVRSDTPRLGFGLSALDALHSQQADHVSISLTSTLPADNAGHAHQAENVSISQICFLEPQEAHHDHLAEEAEVTTTYSLLVNESLLAHFADETAITAGGPAIQMIYQDEVTITRMLSEEMHIKKLHRVDILIRRKIHDEVKV